MKFLAVVMSALLIAVGFWGFWIGLFVAGILDDGFFTILPIWGMRVPGITLMLPGLASLCIGAVVFARLDRPVYCADPRVRPAKK